MARILSDENVSYRLVTTLRELGHDVETAFEAGFANQRIPDEDVLAIAIDEKRAILTWNRDDFHRLHLRVPDHEGIITYTHDPQVEALAKRIDLEIQMRNGQLKGCLIRIVRPSRTV